MTGDYGVFDGIELIAMFSDDNDADDYRRQLLELDRPEIFRRPEYDDLQIREVPENYDLWRRLIDGLRRSRDYDLAVRQAREAVAGVRHGA